jgi:hypothetical protein
MIRPLSVRYEDVHPSQNRVVTVNADSDTRFCRHAPATASLRFVSASKILTCR